MESLANRGTALVLGVASGRSIAWHCANALLNKGYDVIVTYQNDRFRPQVEKLVETKRHELLKKSSHQRGITPSVGEKSTTATTGFQLKFTPTIHCLACDVASDESIENLFDNDLPLILGTLNAKQRGDEEEGHNNSNNNNNNGPLLNAVVHSIAYAPPDAMKDGSLLTTSRESFRIAHDISAYSLIAIARHALPFLRPQPPPQSSSSSSLDTMHQEESHNTPAVNASSSSPFLSSSSITALSYLGATTAIPNYNIMGPAKASLEAIVRGLALELGSCPLTTSSTSLSSTIQQQRSQQHHHYSVRVNCVSAGPLNTMASRGIRNFTAMKLDSECKSPLRRNVTSEEVAEMVAFLAMGDAAGASGITGQTIYVDGGYSSVNGPI